MVTHCILKRCMSDLHADVGRKTASKFRFPPDDTARFEKWMEVLEKYLVHSYWSLHNARICSLHFEESDFHYVKGRRYLNNDAVPSIFKLDREFEDQPGDCPKLSVVVEDITPHMNTQQLHDTSRTLRPNFPKTYQQANHNDGPSLDMPFCRLCFNADIPMHSLYPPADPTAGSQMVMLIQDVAGITINFENDHNSFICLECRGLLEEMSKMLSSWRQNDIALEQMRKKRLSMYPASIVQIGTEHLVENGENCVKIEECEIEEGVAVTPTPTVVVEIPMDRLIEFGTVTPDIPPQVAEYGREAADATTGEESLIVALEPHQPEACPSNTCNDSIALDDAKDSCVATELPDDFCEEIEQLDDSDIIELSPEQNPITVIDLTDIEEKERLIRRAMRELRKSLPTEQVRRNDKRSLKRSHCRPPSKKRKAYSMPAPRVENEI